MAETAANCDCSSEYLTLGEESRAVVREKMSKFIAIAFPVISAADAKAKIKKIANDYHDARHVCWAYVAGPQGQESMSNDNGEPSGTAGRPILGQIRSAGLTNVAVAVVRYFGGIKLGTSGLIEAYREAAREAIAAGTVITRLDEAFLKFRFPYENMEAVMRILKSSEGRILAQEFNLDCTIDFAIRKDRSQALIQRLSDCASVSDITDFA